MKRSWMFLVPAALLFVTACGPGQIAVTAEIDIPDPEAEGSMVTRPIADLEIQVFPFDRDLVFESLASAAATPEPQIPEDLLALQEEIAAAQAEWNQAEATWANGRARLQSIVDAMEPLNQAEAQYIALFREFQDVETQVNRAERIKDQAFDRFTGLQQGYIQRADSMRFIRDQWADEAFATVNEVFLTRVRELGAEILADTTDAQGFALIDVPPGQWWVVAFYEQAFSELYWNLPITVERGDPIQIRLNLENAAIRPRL